ncbi:MAG: endolytic transglycosylase MltG [Vicinamibacterales bacterium]
MKKLLLLLTALVVIGAISAGIAAYVLAGRAREPFRGYETPDVIVEVPRGAGTQTIGTRLIEAGVVRDPLTFRVALWLSGHDRRLQAGEYQFSEPMSAVDVVGKIARGDVLLIPLTFREGLTIREMADVFGASEFGTAEEFMAAARDASLVASIDPEAGDLEGYLFPDTYALPRHADAPLVVSQMVGRFMQVLTPEVRAGADAQKLSIRQLVTLASLVEKETAVPAELPVVAGVYANRLRIGMLLQCDPTVIYALLLAGRYDGNIRRDDLSIDSPYNTYRYAGLPPGPIAAPGQRALEAAARPADVEYLYFVSRNDGSHEFARSLSEHNRNVQRYQVEFFRARRAREGG